MRLLLGLFFSFIMLTTGSYTKCVNCLAINGYCSDVKQECPNQHDICLSFLLKSEDKIPIDIIMKRCAEKNDCKRYEGLKGKAYPSQIPGVATGAVIKQITCSKAPPSFSSFFPAFLGLLLMKLLF